MELTHLDGRKLLIKTQPGGPSGPSPLPLITPRPHTCASLPSLNEGEIVKPMSQGFDPLAKEAPAGRIRPPSARHLPKSPGEQDRVGSHRGCRLPLRRERRAGSWEDIVYHITLYDST